MKSVIRSILIPAKSITRGIETHGDGHLEPQPPPPPTTVHLCDDGRGESPENRWREGYGRRYRKGLEVGVLKGHEVQIGEIT